jgi:hypothetical protein
MKNKLIALYIVMVLLSGMFCFVPQTEGLWWDTDFYYMKVIPITNPSASYQMKIIVNKTSGNINCSGHCQDDFDDIRFTTSDNATLDYWRENYTSGTKAVFYVETDGGTSINMYYGNSTVTTTSNGTNTFLMFDDFEYSNNITSHGWTWEHGYTIPTSYRYHSGSKSIRLQHQRPSTYFHRHYLNAGIFHYFLYDNTTFNGCGQELNSVADARWACDVGHNKVTSSTKYTSTKGGVTTATGINKLIGWHEVQWTYNGSKLSLKLDNTAVYTEWVDAMDELFFYCNEWGAGNTTTKFDWFIDGLFIRKYDVHVPVLGTPHAEVNKMMFDLNPSNTNPSPVNASTGVNITTNLSITVTSPVGNTMNITFSTNASGSWQTVGTRHNVGNGTYSNMTTCFVDYNKKYWWNVSTMDNTSLYDNDTYYFTTNTIHTKINILVPYNQSFNDPLTLTCNGTSDLSNVSLYYRYSTDNTTFSSLINITYRNMEYDASGGGSLTDMDYANTGEILWENASCILGYFAVYGSKSLTIMNLTNASNPLYLNSKKDAVLLPNPHDIKMLEYTTNNLVAFICNYQGTNGLTSWNVTDPLNIVNMDSVNIDGKGMYMALDKTNKVLYLTSDGNNISSWNITDPSSITRYDYSETGINVPWYPALYNNTVLYIGNIGGLTKGIAIYNTTSKGDLTYVTVMNNTIPYPQPFIVDDFLYCVNNNRDKLTIWNISNPLTPVNISFDSFDVATHLFVTPMHYAYLRLYNATSDNGIKIVDCSMHTSQETVEYIVYNITNKFRNIHWIQEIYNNITNQKLCYFYGYLDDSLICYEIDYPNGTDWRYYSIDTTYPFSFIFTYPNGTGYYEFYSIGQKTNSTDETAPPVKDAMCFFLEGANNLPTASNPIPANNSINISRNPQLSITISDMDAEMMNATFRTNATGTWQTIGYNISTNGTYRQYTLNFSSYSTLYYWSINLTDNESWSNYTYHFTTLDNVPPSLSSPNPSNNSIGISISLAQVSISISDYDLFNYTIEMSNGDTVSVNGSSNGTKTLIVGGGLSYGTLYTWWVNATDGLNETTAIYYFTTANSSGGLGGNITVTFDLSQFGLVILMILWFFLLFIGISVKDRTFGGLILLIDGGLLIYFSMALMVVFGASWIFIAPIFAILGVLIGFYGVMTFKK